MKLKGKETHSKIYGWLELPFLDGIGLYYALVLSDNVNWNQSENYVLTKIKCTALSSFLRQYLMNVFWTPLYIISYFLPINENMWLLFNSFFMCTIISYTHVQTSVSVYLLMGLLLYYIKQNCFGARIWELNSLGRWNWKGQGDIVFRAHKGWD